MAISKCETVEHITPSREELQPFHKIYCKAANCSATFTNAGNYELHLMRHHKIMPKNKETTLARRLYYCPVEECLYNFKSSSSARHFKHMKNLRQHFQKVHFKTFICENCGRGFPTEGQFKSHAENVCGKRYNCPTCCWDFDTKDALELHCKRKGHLIQKESAGKPNKFLPQKRDISSLQTLNTITNNKVLATEHKDTQTKVQCNDSETQTEQLILADLVPPTSMMDAISHDTETQTETQINAPFNDINDFHDIETQTDPTLQQRYQRHPSLISNSNSGGGFLDHMLSQTSLAHMHTQTCNDYLLSELGLADIQTQTNWTSFTDGAIASEHSKHMYTTASTSTSTTGFPHDELLVSTETQTSFTQCLLESTAESGPINASTCTTSEENHVINYAHLYNTQCTQTCDLLLDGLFGGQENDLITGFQSTYTQT